MRRNPEEGRRALSTQMQSLPAHLPELQFISKWMTWKKEAEEEGTWKWRPAGELMAPPVHLNVVLESSDDESSDEEAERKKQEEKKKREEEEARASLLVDEGQCAWRKSDALHTYKCSNLRYDDSSYCSYHVEHCIDSSHKEEGAPKAPEIELMNQDGLCRACYERRHAAKPRPQDRVPPKLSLLDVPGVLQVNEQHAMRGLAAAKAGLDPNAAAGGAMLAPEGGCSWARKTADGRRFKCENDGMKHPQTKLLLETCGYHVEACVMQRHEGDCEEYEHPNDLGLCLAHYAEHFLDESRLPPPIESFAAVPGVSEKKKRGRGGVLLRQRYALLKGQALGDDAMDLAHLMPGGDGVKLLRPKDKPWGQRRRRPRRARKRSLTQRVLYGAYTPLPVRRLVWAGQYASKRQWAASKVQALCRGHLARRRVGVILGRARAKRRTAAARTLQRYSRGMLGRKAFKEYHAVMTAAAIQVQRIARGMLSRLHVQWGDAAIKIQTRARILIAIRVACERRAVRALELEQEEEDARYVLKLLAEEMAQREDTAVRCLQNWVRVLKLRKIQAVFRSVRIERKAATTLQTWWAERTNRKLAAIARRRTLAENFVREERKRRFAIRPEAKEHFDGIPLQLREICSRLLQRCWRGYKGRCFAARVKRSNDLRWHWMRVPESIRRQIKNASPNSPIALYHSKKRYHMLPILEGEEWLGAPSWSELQDPDQFLRDELTLDREGRRVIPGAKIVHVPNHLSYRRRRRSDVEPRTQREVKWDDTVRLWDVLPTATETPLVMQMKRLPSDEALSRRQRLARQDNAWRAAFDECVPLTDKQLDKLSYASPPSSSKAVSAEASLSSSSSTPEELPPVLSVAAVVTTADRAKEQRLSIASGRLSIASVMSASSEGARPLPAGIPLSPSSPPLPRPSPVRSEGEGEGEEGEAEGEGEEGNEAHSFEELLGMSLSPSARQHRSHSELGSPRAVTTKKRKDSIDESRALRAARDEALLGDRHALQRVRVAELKARHDVLSEPRMPVPYGVVLKVTDSPKEWETTESYACVFPGCGRHFTHAQAAHLHQQEHRGQPRLTVPAPGADARMGPFWPKDLPGGRWGAPKLRARRPIVGFHICPVRSCRVQFRQKVQLERHMMVEHGGGAVAFPTAVEGVTVHGRTGVMPPMANAPPRTPPCRVCPIHSLAGSRMLITRCEQCREARKFPNVPCELFQSITVPLGRGWRIFRVDSMCDPVRPRVRWPETGGLFLVNVIAIISDRTDVPWLAVARYHLMKAAVGNGLRPEHQYDTAYEMAEEQEVTYVKATAIEGAGAVYCCSRRKFYKTFVHRAMEAGLEPFFCRTLFSHKSNVIMRSRKAMEAKHR